MDKQRDNEGTPLNMSVSAQQAADAYTANASPRDDTFWLEIGQLSEAELFHEKTLRRIRELCGERLDTNVNELWEALQEKRISSQIFLLRLGMLLRGDCPSSRTEKDAQDTSAAQVPSTTEPSKADSQPYKETTIDVSSQPEPAKSTGSPSQSSTITPQLYSVKEAMIVFSHTGGSYNAPFALGLSCSIPKAVIYFTIDGTTPNITLSSSHKYPNKKMTIDRPVNITAQAVVNGVLIGEPSSIQFTFQPESVDFSTPEGTYNPPLTISLMSKTSGASIYYTIDGTEPNEKSTQYSPKDALLLMKSTTVKAIAIKSGWNPSSIAVAAYELKSPQWQVLEPTEANDPVLPHNVSEFNQLSTNWIVVAASVRGKLHAHRALWRDDSYRYDTIGPWTIITVSDGAGSAKLSRVGSRIICDRAVDRLKVLLDNVTLRDDDSQPNDSDLAKISEFLASAARDARSAIAEEANKRSCAFGDFAATLLVSLHCVWKDYDFIATIQVGDGVIALLNDDQTVKLAGIADHGQHSSETKFLTTKNIETEFLHRVNFVMLRGLRSIAVMSDGVSDDFFPEEQRIIELFTGEAIAGMVGIDDKVVDGVAKTVFTNQNPDKVLLEWMKYEKKGSSDDRTLVLAFRR